MISEHYRSECAVCRTLEVLGDKWTLLVVRDLFLNERLSFKQLSESFEGIPTNTLSDRLHRLMDHGLVEREPYQDRPVRYEYMLTRKGRSLLPVLKTLAKWGEDHLGGTYDPDSAKHAFRAES